MLDYIKLILTFKAITNIKLPLYKGSLFRGFFKTSLKRLVCQNYDADNCLLCKFQNECLYFFITEHRNNQGENTVLPYVISCSDIIRTEFDIGENFSFSIKFIGKAISFIDQIILSFVQWNQLEISHFQTLTADKEFIKVENYKDIKYFGKIKLEMIDQITNNNLINIYQSNSVVSSPKSETFLFLLNYDNNNLFKVNINFLSPLRILKKIKNKSNKKTKLFISPDLFNHEFFFRSLLTRLIGLYTNYVNDSDKSNETNDHSNINKADINIDKIVEHYIIDINKVKILSKSLIHEKIKRYSYSSKWIHLDGIIGEVIFGNISERLLNLLIFGSLFHTGKFPTMGMGEYSFDIIT